MGNTVVEEVASMADLDFDPVITALTSAVTPNHINT